MIVECNQRLLTEYHVDAGHKPFFFPMIGPTGDSYTRAYPMQSIAGEDRDHPHQRSCWFTFGNVNGIDFWGEAKESGRVRESSRQIIVEGSGARPDADQRMSGSALMGGRSSTTSGSSPSTAPRSRG